MPMVSRLSPDTAHQASSVLPESASGSPEEKPSRVTATSTRVRCGAATSATAAASCGVGSLNVVLHRVWRMVGEAGRRRDPAGFQALAQRWRHDLVIDPPPDVVGARVAAVGPPGVFLGLGFQHPKADQPSALFRKASGILLVGFPVPDVAFTAHDVPVTAQHEVAAAGQPLVENRTQFLHRLELELL